MKILTIVLATLAIAACGVRPSGVIAGVSAPAGPAKGMVSALYFVSAEGAVVPVHRTAPPGGRDTDLVDVLAAGPDATERADGYSTQVPSTAAPAVVTTTDSTLDVRLSTDVAKLSPAALDQIACTLLARHQGVRSATLRGGGHVVHQACPMR